jgi:hypothetical protein
LTLFEKMDKSPDSGPSRMMITNSNKYGITTGGYQAEFIELTDIGIKATNPEVSDRERMAARIQLAITSIPPFKCLYDASKGQRVPSPEVMRDSLEEVGIPREHRKECVDLFLENAKFLGLLRIIGGAERLVPIEQRLEEVPFDSTATERVTTAISAAEPHLSKAVRKNLKNVCFVIAPIDVEGSEQRKHSDMILQALIERALEKEPFEVVRADKIGDPGMISAQVIDYLLNCGMVVADLSFHNPNVFYELAIRHLIGKPTVHIIREGDVIPFDLKDFRTIVIDTRDKYDLVAKLDTYRAEIANQIRIASSAGSEGTNPIRVFAKNLTVTLTETIVA